jgi:hypothetical protein
MKQAKMGYWIPAIHTFSRLEKSTTLKNQHCYQNRRIISQLVRDYEKQTGDNEIHVFTFVPRENEPLSKKRRKSSFMSVALLN